MVENKKKYPNLFLFPAMPGGKSGYAIAVKSDIDFLKINQDDYKVFIIESNKKPTIDQNTLYISRGNILFRLMNLFSNGHPGIFSGLYLYIVILINFKHKRFDKIIYGDINFFPLINYLKCNHSTIRLHNLYLKMYDSMKSSHLLFKNKIITYECLFFKQIEKNIIKQIHKSKKNIDLLFITEEEQRFFKLNYNIAGDVLPIKFGNMISVNLKTNKFVWDYKLIWFGGLSSHKVIGVNQFIQNIYVPLKTQFSNLSLQLYGAGTEKFNNKNLQINGFGFVNTFDYKEFENSIFIIPDVIGGGIKLKLFDFYKNDIFCISTPLGVEGFPDIKNWQNLKVVPFNEWEKYISDLLKAMVRYKTL